MTDYVSGQKLTGSCAVIGYPSGQDGDVLPVRDYPQSRKKIVFFALGQDGWIMPP